MLLIIIIYCTNQSTYYICAMNNNDIRFQDIIFCEYHSQMQLKKKQKEHTTMAAKPSHGAHSTHLLATASVCSDGSATSFGAVKSDVRGRGLSAASWALRTRSTSWAEQQRAGWPHTARALRPSADAEPPNGSVTRSCLTAPSDSSPRLHSSSRRQAPGPGPAGRGADGNGGRALKPGWAKLMHVFSRSSHRPTNLNSGSGS